MTRRTFAAHTPSPSSQRLIVNRILEQNLLIDTIPETTCQILCDELTSYAARQAVTKDEATYLVGWHDAIHSLRQLIVSRRPGGLFSDTRIEGVPNAPSFRKSLSISEAAIQLMSGPQPFAMTSSSTVSAKNSTVKYNSGSLMPIPAPHRHLSIFDKPKLDQERDSISKTIDFKLPSPSTSNASTTPFNTPSTSALSSPVDGALNEHRRDQPSRPEKSTLLTSIDTTKLLLLYEREARVSEQKIMAELAKQNLIRQGVLSTSFFGTVPFFDTEAIPENSAYALDINEPFVEATQQEWAVKEARKTFKIWSRDETSCEEMLVPGSSHPPLTSRKQSLFPPPSTEKPSLPRPKFPSFHDASSSGTSSGSSSFASSTPSRTNLIAGPSQPKPMLSSLDDPFSNAPSTGSSIPSTGALFSTHTPKFADQTPFPTLHDQLRTESIYSGPTMRVHLASDGTESWSESLLAHFPTANSCKRQARTQRRPSFGYASNTNASSSTTFQSARGPSPFDFFDYSGKSEPTISSIVSRMASQDCAIPSARPTKVVPTRQVESNSMQPSLFRAESLERRNADPFNPGREQAKTVTALPVELPASSIFDRPASVLPGSRSMNSSEPVTFPSTSSRDLIRLSPPTTSRYLRARQQDHQPTTRPLPCQRPLHTPNSRSGNSSAVRETRSPISCASPTQPPSTISDPSSSSWLTAQLPIRPNPIVQVPAEKKGKEEQSLPKIVISSISPTNDADHSEEEDL